MWASTYGHRDIVLTLLEHGVAVNAQNVVSNQMTMTLIIVVAIMMMINDEDRDDCR